MRYLQLLIVLMLSCCELCPAQSHFIVTSAAKTITTTTDTVLTNAPPYEVYQLYVINMSSSTDTLQWWTDADTTKTELAPNEESYRNRYYINKLFRKAKNTSVRSKAGVY